MKTLLIANRGEIARRIMRTATRLGITTVAVFTDADAAAPHVRAADRAVRITDYLDVDAIVAAALATDADAVHPGYGFLSERAALPRALAAAGVGWVGPPADVVELMGRKDAAREVALAAGLDVVPAYDVVSTGSTTETTGSTTETAGPSAEMRFPVLVKAAAGGGGKGMRVVRSAGEYAEAREAARREAAAAFGDDTLLVEAFVERGRHVEVQVLADAHGRVVHLFERDCSSQRRHQKVVEEAPGPTVDAALRHRLTSGAVELARRVGYVGAGTVEFLVDDATGAAYFLEMNTRLQVEHPVTEAVCGHLDLVEEQLRIADGEELGLEQDDLWIHGHAIEVRVYAEDAFGGFLPQAGRARGVRWPAGEGIRVDQALESGQLVGTAYDPMLAKIVAEGPDRETARRRLVAALDRTAVLGLTTNVGFLRALLETPEFRAATLDTAWLDRHPLPPPDAGPAGVVAAWADATRTPTGGPWRSDGWRLGAPPAPVRSVLDRIRLIDGDGDGDGGSVLDGERTYALRELDRDHEVLLLDVDGVRTWAAVDVTDRSVEIVLRGQRFVFTRPDATATTATATEGQLTAPMPGTVTAVDVNVGDLVEAGQRLGVLEAMKMELAVRSPAAGQVTVVGASVGDRVALGERLFVVEDPGA